MNKSALKAAFNSLSFRARLHGAMLSAVKKGYQSYIKNRKGENFIRVDYVKDGLVRGFTFRDKAGKIIDTKLIYSFLRG